jgi:hypothetical protein
MYPAYWWSELLAIMRIRARVLIKGPVTLRATIFHNRLGACR